MNPCSVPGRCCPRSMASTLLPFPRWMGHAISHKSSPTRLILDGQKLYNPLVFWYQRDYLRSPAKFFFAGCLRLVMPTCDCDVRFFWHSIYRVYDSCKVHNKKSSIGVIGDYYWVYTPIWDDWKGHPNGWLLRWSRMDYWVSLILDRWLG